MRAKKNLNKRASYTRSALSVILAEVDPVEVASFWLAGLLGWVITLAMMPLRENY
jgi:hypothetical protein